MAFILSSSFESDKSIALLGEQIARTTTIGSNWTYLRIGVRMTISNSLSDNSSLLGPEVAFGLCAGTSSLYADPSTPHFIGVHTPTAITWPVTNYGNGNVGYNANQGNAVRYIKKVGTGSTEFGNTTPAFVPMFGGSNPVSGTLRHVAWFLDYMKIPSLADPGVWGMKTFIPILSNNCDIPSSSFYTYMSAPTISVAESGNNYATNFNTVDVTESINGHLDTVNLYWSVVNRQMEVTDVAVYRFA